MLVTLGSLTGVHAIFYLRSLEGRRDMSLSPSLARQSSLGIRSAESQDIGNPYREANVNWNSRKIGRLV